MHVLSPAPYATLRVNDGDMLVLGSLRLQMIHTPGHTRDSMCVHVRDRLFTGDTLLIGATGRTDCRPATLMRSTTVCSTAS